MSPTAQDSGPVKGVIIRQAARPAVIDPGILPMVNLRMSVKADMTLATPALSPWAAALTTHEGTRKHFTNQSRADVSSPCPQDCT
jgi:hypothetical protein